VFSAVVLYHTNDCKMVVILVVNWLEDAQFSGLRGGTKGFWKIKPSKKDQRALNLLGFIARLVT